MSEPITMSSPEAHLPVVIVGAGLAGLAVALHLAESVPVIMLAKRKVEESATTRAQGGIVGVLGSDDSIESHVHDTPEAGAGIVDEDTARFFAQNFDEYALAHGTGGSLGTRHGAATLIMEREA